MCGSTGRASWDVTVARSDEGPSSGSGPLKTDLPTRLGQSGAAASDTRGADAAASACDVSTGHASGVGAELGGWNSGEVRRAETTAQTG